MEIKDHMVTSKSITHASVGANIKNKDAENKFEKSK
jgi:hypothetical protein